MEFSIVKGEKKKESIYAGTKGTKIPPGAGYLKLQSGSTLQIIEDPDDWENA